uniref:TTF-type domain-containing protein n=1 Tax=Arion vulgaris TaxID=1028688 RepID=A0A0B7BLW7_9EUPU
MILKATCQEVGKRCFRESWLTQYTPWLSYSPRLKGAFCIFCVLFPQPVQRGIQGAFITTPCTKYKDFNECARNHTSSAWHRGSQQELFKLIFQKSNCKFKTCSV